MPKYKIDNNIPISDGLEIPPAYRSDYLHGKLKVGQSYFVPGDAQGRKAAAAAMEHAKRHGRRYTARLVTEEGIAGRRIWRLA